MVVSISIEAAVLSVAAAVVVVDVAVSTDGLRVSNRVKKKPVHLEKRRGKCRSYSTKAYRVHDART